MMKNELMANLIKVAEKLKIIIQMNLDWMKFCAD